MRISNKFLSSTMLSGLILGAVVGGLLIPADADARTSRSSQAQASRTLYGTSQSPYVIQIQVILQEKNIPFTLNSTASASDISNSAFTQFTPGNMIPTYQEGNVSITEPSAIAQYIERTHPSPALIPTDRTELARALEFESFGNHVLGSVVQRATGGIEATRGSDQAQMQIALREELPRIFDALERELGSNQYIAGNRFTIADIAMGSQFVSLQRAGETISTDRWPRLAAYVERVLSRNSFRTAIGSPRTS